MVYLKGSLETGELFLLKTKYISIIIELMRRMKGPSFKVQSLIKCTLSRYFGGFS